MVELAQVIKAAPAGAMAASEAFEALIPAAILPQLGSDSRRPCRDSVTLNQFGTFDPSFMQPAPANLITAQQLASDMRFSRRGNNRWHLQLGGLGPIGDHDETDFDW